MHLAAEVDVAGLGQKTECQITLLANHRPPSSMDELEVCHVGGDSAYLQRPHRIGRGERATNIGKRHLIPVHQPRCWMR